MLPFKNTFEYKLAKLRQDAGINWDNLSLINKFQFRSKSLNSFENSNNLVSLSYDQKAIDLSFTKIFFSEKNFFIFFNPNILTDEKFKSTNISMNNISYVGFNNNWSLIQFGNGKESWGAGSDIELCLNDNSEFYEYFLLASDYGNIRVRYIHGFLEKINTNYNRYLNARGIEWTNKKNIVLALF